jgi:hypothetical protein
VSHAASRAGAVVDADITGRQRSCGVHPSELVDGHKPSCSSMRTTALAALTSMVTGCTHSSALPGAGTPCALPHSACPCRHMHFLLVPKESTDGGVPDVWRAAAPRIALAAAPPTPPDLLPAVTCTTQTDASRPLYRGNSSRSSISGAQGTTNRHRCGSVSQTLPTIDKVTHGNRRPIATFPRSAIFPHMTTRHVQVN